MAKLIIRDVTGGERVHELVDDVTTMGRGSGNIIQVKDKEASRSHCRVEKTPDGHRLVDLGSRNGTKVNNVKVSTQTLKKGDEIRIGDFASVYDTPVEATADDLGATVGVAPLDEKNLGAPADGKPKYVIEVVEGSDKGKVLELGTETFTIGRKSSNNYPINDESASSFHAEISREPTGYFLTDLGSTNGTKVGGEKIVKTRLQPGSEISIGTTKMLFKNVGAKSEEDEVFGTVVLDTERLERELAEDEAASRTAFLKRLGLVVGGVAVVAAVVLGGIYTGAKGSTPIEGNVIGNFSFDKGVSDRGDPQDWRSVGTRFTPWQVLTDVDRDPQSPSKGALAVERDPEAALDEYAECYTPIEIAGDRSHTLGGWIRTENNAQGVYGLRVRWIGTDERTAVSQVYVMGTQSEWREIKCVVHPPVWARRAEVLCFSYGRRGKVLFDDVYMIPAKTATEMLRYDVVHDRIRVEPVKSGEFAVRTGTEQSVMSAGVFLVGAQDAESTQSIADPEDPQPEKNGFVFGGAIPEFFEFATVRYLQKVWPGELGVVIEYELRSDRPLPLSCAGLRFTVVGAIGAGQMQAFDADGRPLRASTGKLRDAKELLFESPEGERLAVFLTSDQGAFRVEAQGDRKQVEITWPGQVTIGKTPSKLAIEFNTASRFERLEVDAALEVVKRARAGGDVSAEVAALQKVVAMSDRFKPESEKALAELTALTSKVRAEIDEVRRLLDKFKITAAEEGRKAVVERAKELLVTLAAKYAGPPFADQVAALGRELTTLVGDVAVQQRESDAQKAVDQVLQLIKAENLPFAKAYWKRLETDYADTRAFKAAQEGDVPTLLDGLEKLLIERDGAYRRLEHGVKLYEMNKQMQDALRLFETSPDYKRFKDDPRFKRLYERVKAAAEEAPAP